MMHKPPHGARMALFTILAIFALLLIGSGHSKEDNDTKPENLILNSISLELPADQRGEWQNAINHNSLWLLESATRFNQ